MRNFWLYLLCIVFLSSTVASAQVMSIDIVASDGTTSQDITKGSGIKTPHIQDGAVTGAKIATGTTITANISYATNAGTAASVPASGITGTVSYADKAGSVPASGITGTVLYATKAGIADTVPDNAIGSAQIAEATGAPEQNTDTGVGIKTGHLQDGAVTH